MVNRQRDLNGQKASNPARTDFFTWVLAIEGWVIFYYGRFLGMMYYDYNKRSYLLPPGCKDLIDLLRLEEQKKRPSIQLPFLQTGDISLASPQDILGPWKLKKKELKEPHTGAPSSASIREVVIPGEILVKELAKISGQKPFKIIADLMEIGIFSNVTQMIGFEAASRVLQKYGIAAKKAG